MLKNQNIICISSIDWDFIWQQHQTIMSTFAKNGNRVLFIENTGVRAPGVADAPRLMKRARNWFKSVKGFKEVDDGLYVYSPLILPFPYLRLARWINKYFLAKTIKRWMSIMGFRDPIIWTFLPTPLVLDICDAIPHKAFIYYCTDNFSATSVSARKIVKYEKKVVEKADAVFVMARNLAGNFYKYNKNTTCVPMGVDVNIFVKSDGSSRCPSEIEGVKNKIVGFVGGVRNSIDQELVKSLARSFPEFLFVFVGPIQTDISGLKNEPNVIFIGQKKHYELPDYIKRYDVCMIPYVKDPYTDNISPGKLNEYLIMGKPVVSTNLNEVEVFNRENGDIVYIAKDRDEYRDLITKAISQDNDNLRKARKKAALSNSWDVKIEEMSRVVDNVIRKKESESMLNWQRRFLDRYKVVRSKTVKLVLILALAYIAIFYSPLVWFLAEPLQISDVPRKADAIVVFAGGVGESGKAGQGYEERVQQAVALYKQGYAEHIILSSGYVYLFKEPRVMKALAVSLGVPDKAIILEENAKNTIENVIFTKKILESERWRKILLVTSSYHTRRSSLVFKKNAKDLDVAYVPIKNSLFYLHDKETKSGKKAWKKITGQQIGGIVHEYLSIIYYWVKGYI